jgi:hypothetical protein
MIDDYERMRNADLLDVVQAYIKNIHKILDYNPSTHGREPTGFYISLAFHSSDSNSLPHLLFPFPPVKSNNRHSSRREAITLLGCLKPASPPTEAQTNPPRTSHFRLSNSRLPTPVSSAPS